ncbi:hypothetical protein GC105_12825 [Alkalibaculum sp. M08DMB]|uniref:ABC-transporter type IV n=1 Tax=Alkalibaculum sporogenes TaxID=2655001 RepID=A0A6A7KCD1_9FIRM|nr:hypothetical protein [Alkalibaculum sporogenes]MPW26673.1 hypothetical protein [Alkalibaculum sporogenes]
MKNTVLHKYAIYGLLGICLEIFWTGFCSLLASDITMAGYSSIWMFFIYGLAVFLEPVHNEIREHNIIVRGSIYMVIIFAIEFITGFILNLILGACPWNYTGQGSVYGLITLYFIPVWFFTGLLFEKAHDFLDLVIFDSRN